MAGAITMDEMGLRHLGSVIDRVPAQEKGRSVVEFARARARYDAKADVLYVRFGDRRANRIVENNDMIVSLYVPWFGLGWSRPTLVAITLLDASKKDYVSRDLLEKLVK